MSEVPTVPQHAHMCIVYVSHAATGVFFLKKESHSEANLMLQLNNK